MKKMKKNEKKARHFTLIELLVITSNLNRDFRG